MARNFGMRVCVYTMWIALLTSAGADLITLEELSLEMQQMKQNNEDLGSKIQRLEQNDELKSARLQALELKVKHLEAQLIENQTERNRSVHSAVKENTVHFGKHVSQGKIFFRTCRELYRSDRSLRSGMYWIDPDGYGFDDPIHVHCDMETGTTSVSHDSENATTVGDCAAPGCYSKSVKYSAPIRQMKALAELSNECHQSIRYDCKSAPFKMNGVAQSWWNDRNGVAQYFWSGNRNIRTCQCGIDKNCVSSPHHSCNCDSNSSNLLSDIGVITDKRYLPITGLNFGRTQLDTSTGIHTLGRFECSGQSSVNGVPTSCSDLWKIGHTLSGIYSIKGSDYVAAVYCDFTRLPDEQGFQTLIGYTDVKSMHVYFYVQKLNHQTKTGRVSFELTRLNIGGAMNANSGIFTAPKNGIYSFAFTGLGFYPASGSPTILRIALMMNGSETGRIVEHTQDDRSWHTFSLNSILKLKAGDQVWLNIVEILNGAYLYGNSAPHHYTHFTGHLLQENIAHSL